MTEPGDDWVVAEVVEALPPMTVAEQIAESRARALAGAVRTVRKLHAQGYPVPKSLLRRVGIAVPATPRVKSAPTQTAPQPPIGLSTRFVPSDPIDAAIERAYSRELWCAQHTPESDWTPAMRLAVERARGATR